MTEPTTTSLPYRYFVSYNWGGGVGSFEACISQPVSTWADVTVLTDFAVQNVRRHRPLLKTDQVVITNYQLLSGPETGSAEQALRDLLAMVGQFDTPRDPGRVQAFVGDVRQVALRGLGHRHG